MSSKVVLKSVVESKVVNCKRVRNGGNRGTRPQGYTRRLTIPASWVGDVIDKVILEKLEDGTILVSGWQD